MLPCGPARPPPPPSGSSSLATLLLIAALVAAGLYVGSRPRVPAPFGPARNGAMVFARPTGEIVVHDPFDSPPRLLIAAVERRLSSRPTRLTARGSSISASTGAEFDLVTARADGTEVDHHHAQAPAQRGPVVVGLDTGQPVRSRS